MRDTTDFLKKCEKIGINLSEKQISQSINFSQKEHEAISANVEKMLVLRQKIQMIAELI